MRHEILNEIGKEEVYSDVVSWIDLILTTPKEIIGTMPDQADLEDTDDILV